jgi:hypothetical protein
VLAQSIEAVENDLSRRWLITHAVTDRECFAVLPGWVVNELAGRNTGTSSYAALPFLIIERGMSAYPAPAVDRRLGCCRYYTDADNRSRTTLAIVLFSLRVAAGGEPWRVWEGYVVARFNRDSGQHPAVSADYQVFVFLDSQHPGRTKLVPVLFHQVGVATTASGV